MARTPKSRRRARDRAADDEQRRKAAHARLARLTALLTRDTKGRQIGHPVLTAAERARVEQAIGRG